MSFYLDRLEAARRQQQQQMRMMVPAGTGCAPPPRPWPCYQYQHAAATLLPRSPPLPVPVRPHAGDGRASGEGAGGGRDAWRGGRAAVAWGEAAPTTGTDAGGWVGGGGEVRNKRCTTAPIPDALSPPPKRRAAVPAFRRFPPGCGRDAAAAPPLPNPRAGCGDDSRPEPSQRRGGGVLLFEAAAASPNPSAASPRASAVNKVSLDAGAPGAAPVKQSGAPGRNSVAVADAPLSSDTASHGVAVAVARPVSVSVIQKQSMVSAYRRFPPGCGRPESPLLAGGGSSQVCSVQAIPGDRDHELEIVAPVCSDTEDGAAKKEGLEEGEIASEAQESPSATTLHCEAATTACTHGNSSTEEMVGNTWQFEENSKSGGSSCNVVAAESLPQRLPKEHMEKDERVSERATTDTATSGVAAVVSDGAAAMMRKKVMFTARKSVKPPYLMQKPAPCTQCMPISKEAEEEETQLGRHTSAAIEDDTNEFAKAVQHPIPIGNAWQCEQEGKSGGSSGNVVAESVDQGLPKEDLGTVSVAECGTTDTATSGVAAGVPDGGGATMPKKKVMLTPRKSVKPPKSMQKPPLLTTRSASFSKETEQEETELGRHNTNGIEDTDDFTKDRAMQDHIPMSSEKRPWASKANEAATVIIHYFDPKKKKMKPPKLMQKPAPNTQYGMPISKEAEEEEKTELGRHTSTAIEHDTYDFTKDRAVQDPMSEDKSPWTNKANQAASIIHYFGPKKKKNKVSDNNKDSILKDDGVLKALATVHEGKFEHEPHRDADARTKVKTLCSRFESICRSIVQAVEQRSLNVRRIDLAADKLIRKLPGFTKPGPIIGDVPGVEVGDEFLYRVQLALVGLHRPYQGGIDTTKDEHGMLIAISVVASGGYPDELSCPGELIYTGSGGKKGVGDQKLEHGNLALRNCVERKSPVRVIHGFKGLNREAGSHSRAKEVSRFTYDGLYRVVKCWIEGPPGSKVLKYKLQRIPGQPGLSLQVAKFVRKNNA
ncbi:unnamed protein product [Urochloa humidicola]